MIGFVPVMTHLLAREIRAVYDDSTYGDQRPQTLLLWTANSNQHAFFPGDESFQPISWPVLQAVGGDEPHWRLPSWIQDTAPNGSHHKSDWGRYPQIFDPKFPHRGFILRPSLGRECDPVLYTDLARIPSSWEPKEPGSRLGIPSVAIVDNLCSRWKEIKAECDKRNGKLFRSFPADASFHLFHQQSVVNASHLEPRYLAPIASLRSRPMTFADAQYVIESLCRGMREKLAWCRLFDRIQEGPFLTNLDLPKVGGRAADDDLLGCWANRMEQDLLSFLFGCCALPLFFVHINKGSVTYHVQALVVPEGPTRFTDFTDVEEELRIDLYRDLPDAPTTTPCRSGPHDLLKSRSLLNYMPSTDDERWATRDPRARRPNLDPRNGFLRRSSPLHQGWSKPSTAATTAQPPSRSESWFISNPGHWDEIVAPAPFEHSGSWTKFVMEDDPWERDPTSGQPRLCMRKLGEYEDPDGRRYLVPQQKRVLYLTSYDTPFGIKDPRLGSPAPRCNYFSNWNPQACQFTLAASSSWLVEYSPSFSLQSCQSWVKWATKWQFHPRRLQLFAKNRTPLRKQTSVFLPLGERAIGGVSQDFAFDGSETDDMFEFYNVINPMRPPPARKSSCNKPFISLPSQQPISCSEPITVPAAPTAVLPEPFPVIVPTAPTSVLPEPAHVTVLTPLAAPPENDDDMKVDLPPPPTTPAEPMNVDPSSFPTLPRGSRFGPPLPPPVTSTSSTSRSDGRTYAQIVSERFQEKYGSHSSIAKPSTIEVFRPDPRSREVRPIIPVLVPAADFRKGKEKAPENLSLVLPMPPLNPPTSHSPMDASSSSVSPLPVASSSSPPSIPPTTIREPPSPSTRWSDYEEDYHMDDGPSLAPLRRSSLLSRLSPTWPPEPPPLATRIAQVPTTSITLHIPSSPPAWSAPNSSNHPIPISRCMIVGNWTPELDEADWANILSEWICGRPVDILILTRKVSPYQLVHIRTPNPDIAREAILDIDTRQNGQTIVRANFARDLTAQERQLYAGESRIPPPERRGKRHQKWRESNRKRILELYENLRL